MNKFEIKYLFELYPDTDFTDEFVTCQEVNEIPSEYESVSTANKWGWLRDSITANRAIQTYKKRKYECVLIIGRNIDLARLQVAETTLTTSEDEEFIIYDVSTNYTKVPGRMDYKLELSFYRYDDDIINHLSSDNVYTLCTEQSLTPNKIMFDVVKPSFAVTGEVLLIPGGTYPYKLRIPYTDEFNGLSTLDNFYIHGLSGLDYATVYSVSSTYVIFMLVNYTGGAISDAYYIIDQTAGELTEDSNVELNPVTLTYYIYTFLHPKYDYLITPEAGANLNEIEENQKTNSKKRAKFKCWLKEDELWKYEQIQHALPENIQVSLNQSTIIVPQQSKGILTPSENENLIRLYEFDIEILYNNKTVAFFR